MTSNVGFIKDNIGFNNKISSNINEYFDKPFINRIDSIIKFNNLNEESVRNIVEKRLNLLKNKYKNRRIIVKLSKHVINDIIQLSNYEEYGARKIDKIVKNELEPLIINKILENRKTIFIKNLKKEKVIN